MLCSVRLGCRHAIVRTEVHGMCLGSENAWGWVIVELPAVSSETCGANDVAADWFRSQAAYIQEKLGGHRGEAKQVAGLHAPAPWFSRLLPPLAAAMVAEPAAEQTTGFMSISIDTVAQEAQNARGRKCVCACDIMLKKPQTLNAWSHCSYGTRRWYNESRSFCDTEGPFNHDSLESEVPHDDADIKDILSMM